MPVHNLNTILCGNFGDVVFLDLDCEFSDDVGCSSDVDAHALYTITASHQGK